MDPESVADFAAAELVAAQNSASPAVKPRLIANRLRMVDNGSPQQPDNEIQPEGEGEGEGKNVALVGAAMTIQR
eukprot:scaffold31287_cov57-Phaeocystis_antarctica.AAC.1